MSNLSLSLYTLLRLSRFLQLTKNMVSNHNLLIILCHVFCTIFSFPLKVNVTDQLSLSLCHFLHASPYNTLFNGNLSL